MSERPKGWVSTWRPQTKSRDRITDVKEILSDFDGADLLPTTVRAVYYKMVTRGHPKTDSFYESLKDLLNMMRRYLGEHKEYNIPSWWITDFNCIQGNPWWDESPVGFFQGVRESAENYEESRLSGQTLNIMVWVEAAGFVAACRNACDPYSVPVISGGGQDSTSLRMAIATRIFTSDKPALIFHIGDYDGQGLTIFETLRDDLPLLSLRPVEVRRLAVIDLDQAADMGLATRPANTSKKSQDHKRGITTACEAEAIDLKVLHDMIETAIRNEIDLDIYEACLRKEEINRKKVLAALSHLPKEYWADLPEVEQ